MEGMDGNRPFPYNGDQSSTPIQPQEEPAERINIEQLQRLVHMLDTSDVSEIELKRAGEGVHGMRLVLRKARVTADGERNGQVVVTATSAREIEQPTPAEPTLHNVVAPLVGIFHSWARVKGGSLVAVGDRVKVGQLVATIQSLNVLNEVDSPIAGRVTELLVQDGQAVEYGQPLMVIDSKEGA